MSSYSSNDKKPPAKKRGRPKKVKASAPPPAPDPEPEPTPAPAPAKKSSGKMSEKQKAELKSHMEKMKKGGMSSTEAKSHRMGMMIRVRKGMTIKSAHADLMGK
tara:strand:+ start:129 stop:440 length:312 start_codon:yes stop_codon:yes gene_type:complete